MDRKSLRRLVARVTANGPAGSASCRLDHHHATLHAGHSLVWRGRGQS